METEGPTPQTRMILHGAPNREVPAEMVELEATVVAAAEAVEERALGFTPRVREDWDLDNGSL